MTDPREQLERLISRCLDGEASAEERRDLQRALRRNPSADALFEEYAALDREAGHAIRAAVAAPGIGPVLRRPSIWREAGLALAACVAMLVWLQPLERPSAGGAADASRASWFAPPPTTTDSWTDDARSVERLGVPMADTDREWIVVPGERPGEYLVIEVNRTRTRLLQLRRDF